MVVVAGTVVVVVVVVVEVDDVVVDDAVVRRSVVAVVLPGSECADGVSSRPWKTNADADTAPIATTSPAPINHPRP